MKTFTTLATVLLLSFGCASKPPLTRAGFLHDYSRLQSVDSDRLRYVSPKLKSYSAFIVDPIEFMVPPKKLNDQDRAEVARYFRSKLERLIQSKGHQVVDNADVNVARVRIAMTDVAVSTWWKRLHPGVRVTGAGTGGASCEGELIDSVTGEQLAAWVSTATASQFDFTAFTTVADVKSVIDRWVANAGRHLDEAKGVESTGR